ncbi:MAG: hypothetical protein AAF569_08405 [Pseudomonadota bacterium]
MTSVFEPHERVTSAQVFNYFENGFRKIVVRYAADKIEPRDNLDQQQRRDFRIEGIDQILETLSKVYTKAVQDNPDDAIKITDAAIDELRKSLQVLSKICLQRSKLDQGELDFLTQARPKFWGVQSRIALSY